MPRKLKHASVQRVVQRRGDQPLPEPHVVLPRPGADRVPRDGELRAAADGDELGDRGRGEELLEGVLVDVLGEDLLRGVLLRLVLRGSDLARTPDYPDAAQVDVADSAEVGEAEVPEGREGVVVRVVVVPGEPRRVHEEHVLRQAVVAIDHVRQVHHRLAALVHGHRQRRARVVGYVDVRVPVGEQGGDPGRVL